MIKQTDDDAICSEIYKIESVALLGPVEERVLILYHSYNVYKRREKNQIRLYCLSFLSFWSLYSYIFAILVCVIAYIWEYTMFKLSVILHEVFIIHVHVEPLPCCPYEMDLSIIQFEMSYNLFIQRVINTD